jgi:hypothetical protein
LGEEAIVPMFYTGTLDQGEDKISITGYALSGVYGDAEDDGESDSGSFSDYVASDVSEEFAAKFCLYSTQDRQPEGKDELEKDMEGVKNLWHSITFSL